MTNNKRECLMRWLTVSDWARIQLGVILSRMNLKPLLRLQPSKLHLTCLQSWELWQVFALTSIQSLALISHNLRVHVHTVFFSFDCLFFGRKVLAGCWGVLWACVHVVFFFGRKSAGIIWALHKTIKRRFLRQQLENISPLTPCDWFAYKGVTVITPVVFLKVLWADKTGRCWQQRIFCSQPHAAVYARSSLGATEKSCYRSGKKCYVVTHP